MLLIEKMYIDFHRANVLLPLIHNHVYAEAARGDKLMKWSFIFYEREKERLESLKSLLIKLKS
jgi:hypothetical protein